MTRDEILDHYRPLRAGIVRMLKDAPNACTDADLKRAWADVAPGGKHQDLGDEIINMVADVALFEPGPRGRRAIDRYRKQVARHVTPEDQDLLSRMGGAWFSVFRVAERHPEAGLWLEDLLDGDRRIWLIDEGLEHSSEPNLIVGLRVFDAGHFHAAFGICVQPTDMSLGLCLAAQARRVPLVQSGSVASLFYSEFAAMATPLDAEELDMLEAFAGLIGFDEPPLVIEHEARPRIAKSRQHRPKPRA